MSKYCQDAANFDARIAGMDTNIGALGLIDELKFVPAEFDLDLGYIPPYLEYQGARLTIPELYKILKTLESYTLGEALAIRDDTTSSSGVNRKTVGLGDSPELGLVVGVFLFEYWFSGFVKEERPDGVNEDLIFWHTRNALRLHQMGQQKEGRQGSIRRESEQI